MILFILQITRWYSRTAHQRPGQELVDSLRVILTDTLVQYKLQNGALPKKIIVYRDGVGEGQLRYVADHEAKQMYDCFASFGESYQPQLSVVVVCKRVNTRMFAIKVMLITILFTTLYIFNFNFNLLTNQC